VSECVSEITHIRHAQRINPVTRKANATAANKAVALVDLHCNALRFQFNKSSLMSLPVPRTIGMLNPAAAQLIDFKAQISVDVKLTNVSFHSKPDCTHVAHS
jgi:hypothetical protein